MVRILHIVTYMGRGGLETMLMNYYRHIDRSQLQFDFLVHRDFKADYDDEILSLGGRIHRISRLIPWSASYRKTLTAFFRTHPEYRIVHVHQDCLSSVALQCAQEAGVPIRIAHSQNAGQSLNLKYLIKRFYMKQIPRYATDLFACSKAAGDWMFGGAPYKLIANAIDVNAYIPSPAVRQQYRQQLHLGTGPVIGHVGRFHPVKNHSFLLDVFREVVNLAPDARLLLVGDGPLRQQMEETVAALHLQDHVIFTGVRTDVAGLMQAMDVFCFPSVHEGLPVTLIEAQSAGLPCLVSDQVSAECRVTERLVEQFSLTLSPARWAEKLLQLLSVPRADHSAEIVQSGYDIHSATHALQLEYLSREV